MIIKYSQIITIGSGPSSYTFSIYAVRSNLNIIIISGKNLGGQLTKTNIIENWPSTTKIGGRDLMLNFYDQALKFNIEIYIDEVYSIDLLTNPFIVFSKKFFFIFEFLIICTGSFHKILKLKNQNKYIGKNISNCSICDGNFFLKKKIIILGGGDSCFENLNYLLNISKNIILINRNKIFKCNFDLIKKAFFKSYLFLKLKINYYILEFIGDDYSLKYIKIKNFYNFCVKIIYIDALFIFIGNIPNSKLFKGQLRLNKNYILTKKSSDYNSLKTSINKILCAGEVQDFLYKQAITSSSSGCVAYFDLLKLYKKFFYKNV
ncbi:Thioredoxin reductase [Candidatus Nasuia deltocephalinicola]|uniref:Thioredoxin reductase n=1 Tax=Candidatus Nasuia deltocephalincola TaxID=1160784 RepID=A0A7G6UHV7_9PROT|nr:Thioredoxin reductase [Candidatus Nasuia deltocephalinicola]